MRSMPIPSVVPHFDAAAASASASNDAVLLIASKPSAVTGLGAAVDAALAAAGAADRRFDAQGNVTVLAVAEAAGHRVVVSPAGPLTRDWGASREEEQAEVEDRRSKRKMKKRRKREEEEESETGRPPCQRPCAPVSLIPPLFLLFRR